MRSHHLLLLACTLPQQVLPFAPSWRVRRLQLRASDADDIDANEAARIEEMRKRMEGMFSGAEAEAARADTQARESSARAHLSEAEGEAGALRAEVTALAKLLERDTAEGGQVTSEGETSYLRQKRTY